MKRRVVSLLLTLMLLAGALTLPAGAEGVGLSIIVDEGVTVYLHTGTTRGNVEIDMVKLVEATSVTTENGKTTYFYENLASGKYYYSQHQSGYYTLLQLIYYPKARAQSGWTIQGQTMTQKAGTSFEPKDNYGVLLPTQEVLDAGLFASAPDMWGEEYEKLYTTPYFLRDKSVKGLHQQTTHQEMLDFIRSLDDADDNMFVYDWGRSPKYNYEMPIVLFTKDDVAGKTIEEAAEIVKADGKPTLHFQGEVHANEVAAGEVTLAFIKRMDEDYGEDILDKMNVYFIPRVNPDGARNQIRGNVANAIDMNRDYMKVVSEEIRLAIAAYNLFLPEAAIDTHEMYSIPSTSSTSRLNDVNMNMAGSYRNSREMDKTLMTILQLARDNALAKGLRAGAYSDHAISLGPVYGDGYYGARGSLVMLTESRGMYSGMHWIERRMAASYTCLSTFINYIADHADDVVRMVRENREDLIARGATYDEEDLYTVRGTYSECGPAWAEKEYDMNTGAVLNDNVIIHTTSHNPETDVTLARPRATAYLIPKDLPKADKVTELAEKHGIRWYELPAGNSAELKQYYFEGDNIASLTEEKTVAFENGAYVFPMDQAAANVLAVLMEPDSIKPSSEYIYDILQMGYVEQGADGYVPVYRYCHDLDEGRVTPVLPETAPGDLNGDEKVNAKDVVLMMRHVAGGYGIGLWKAEADFNGDNVVNGKDAVLLMRHIAGGYGVTLS